VRSAETARRLEREQGWIIAPAGDGFRRLVASPTPINIVEREQIRRLVAGGTLTIVLGGGGTPIYRDPVKGLEGVDGVIDKDRAAEVLAREIGADALLILTNVDGVYRGYDTPRQELLSRLTVAEAAQLLEAGEFGRGTMAPKIEAAMRFARITGGRAHIARLDRGLEAIRDGAGTTIVA
jgi:carbamate kinase